jgi:uncharacterized protein
MSANPQRVLSWFEIPVADIERATRFYETALDMKLRREQVGTETIAVFSYDQPCTGGCLIERDDHQPMLDGATLYLNATPNVDAALARVERAGGKTQGPVVQLPNDIGYIAFFTDSEGNRLGLHSPANG